MRQYYVWALVVLFPLVLFAAESDTTEVAAIRSRIAGIDSSKVQLNDRLMVYCVDPEDQHLIPITDTSDWPEETLSTYNFIYDSLGTLVEFVDFPTSESGDWFMSNDYYFYPSGRLMAFDHYFGGFNTDCTELLRVSLTLYFSESGELLHRAALYEDKENHPIDTAGCYNYDGGTEPQFYSVQELQLKIFKENYLGQEIKWPIVDPSGYEEEEELLEK